MNTNKKTVKIAAAAILALSLLSAVARYICTYHVKNGILTEVSGIFGMITETVLPLLAAVAMLAAYAECETYKRPLIHNLIYSASWLLPLFLERFSEYSFSGYEVGYALMISLIWGVLASIMIYAEHTVLFFIIIFATRIFANKCCGGFSGIKEYVHSDTAFDFSNPVTVGIFSAAAALFFYNLGTEIANTVSFILTSSGIYTAGEILYLVFRYVLILALLIFSHLASHLGKTFFIKNQN